MRQLEGKGHVGGESKGAAVAPEKYLETGMLPEKTNFARPKWEYMAYKVAGFLLNGVFLEL